jgi:dTDP-4-dehydrorhamnose reductase
MDAAEIVIDSLNEQKQGTYLVGGAERLSISEMLQKVCQVFLPGQVPQHVEHEEALDQIIESTYTILNRITFHEALIAIKKGLNY